MFDVCRCSIPTSLVATASLHRYNANSDCDVTFVPREDRLPKTGWFGDVQHMVSPTITQTWQHMATAFERAMAFDTGESRSTGTSWESKSQVSQVQTHWHHGTRYSLAYSMYHRTCSSLLMCVYQYSILPIHTHTYTHRERERGAPYLIVYIYIYR